MPDIVVGHQYGYRDHPYRIGDSLRPVEVLKLGPPKSRKVRIRWLDGEYEGMDEWISQVRLVVPWDEAEDCLKDERSLLAAITASGNASRETAEYRAVEEVFFAIPRDMDRGYIGIESRVLTIEDFERTARKLELPTAEYLAEPHAFVSRFGNYTAPFSVAVRLAQHCCRRFPRKVLLYITPEEDAQRESLVTGYYVDPHSEDNEYDVDRGKAEEFLRKTERSYALIREWCGVAAVAEYDQVTSLRAEVDRLRGVIGTTAQYLEGIGQKGKAAALRRELDPRSHPKQDRRSRKISSRS